MRLTYLLDTNICIYLTKHKPTSVVKKFSELSFGEVAMSVITYGELLYGAQRSQHSAKAHKAIQNITKLIPVLNLPADAARQYGEIRSVLAAKGKIIGGNDLWIAAHAMSEDIVLVSNNLKEFSRIDGLRFENWVK